MRFKFCGDADCPDWLLVQINNLSKMTSIKMKVLSNLVVKSILGENIDKEKLSRITTEAKLDEKDSQGCVAAIAFIITSASRYAVSEKSLSNELQQIGFPHEHASALCRVFCDNVGKLTTHLANNSLRLSKLEGVSCSDEGDFVQVALKTWERSSNSVQSTSFNIDKQQLVLLLADLKQVYSRMEEIEAESNNT
nr:PREDICTED: COMM domain-containing protein 4 [Bemisia tabaci]